MRPLATLALRNPRQHPESDLQRAVVQYWALQYPTTWALTTHHPSGMAAGSARHAAVLVGLGMKRGVPDLLCFARRGPYSGLAVELKADPKAKASAEQMTWLDALEQEGWYAWLLHDFAGVKNCLDQYHLLPRWTP
jgi:hypothetical protein